MATDNSRRLDSWKQIADYLGRDPSTVRRWEGEKRLPVHRVPGGRRQNVFAYQDEIDGWLAQGAPDPEAGVGDGQAALQESPLSQTVAAAALPRRWRAAQWVAAGMALPVVAAILSLGPGEPAPLPIVQSYSEIDDQGSGLVLRRDIHRHLARISGQWLPFQLATAPGRPGTGIRL